MFSQSFLLHTGQVVVVRWPLGQEVFTLSDVYNFRSEGFGLTLAGIAIENEVHQLFVGLVNVLLIFGFYRVLSRADQYIVNRLFRINRRFL